MRILKNNVTLVGNMGSDARVTNFENGGKVVRFELAQDKSYRSNSGETKNKTEWHKVFAWGYYAQMIEQFGGKGKKVAIIGHLVNRTYVNREGIVRNITEVEIREILRL